MRYLSFPLINVPVMAAPARVSPKRVMTVFVLAAFAGAVPSSRPAMAATPSAKKAALHQASLSLPAVSGWAFTLDDDELEKSWTWTANLQAGSDFESRVAFDWQNDKNYLLLRVVRQKGETTLRFWRVADGEISKLGDPEVSLSAPGSPVSGKLTIQRSAWRIRALWNGRAVVTATADTPDGALRFGVASHGKSVLTAPRMQPTDAVTLRDDFMRAQGPDDPEVPGQWHRAAGIWKTSGLLGPRADAALNPNPFVFRAENPTGRAEATVGEWSWTDYTVEASIRPALQSQSGKLIAGVAAYRQEDGTSVVGEVDFRKGVALIRSGDKVLATSDSFSIEPDQWHRVFLDPGPGTIRLVVDGIERARFDMTMRAPSVAQAPLAQGNAALTSEASEGNWIDFDDVRIAPNAAAADDFSTPSVGRWTDVLGEWQTRRADPKTETAARRAKITDGIALSLTGADTREEGRIEASFVGKTVSPASAASPFGVAFAARDAGNYLLARVRPNAVQIVQMSGGAEKVLGTKAGKTDGNVEVEWRDGVILAHSGGTTATASPGTIAAGRVGLWADGTRGSWAATDFRALGAAPVWGEGDLPERFTKDHLMQYWAANELMWQPVAADTSGTRWNVGDFFSDATVALPIPDLTAGQKITVLSGASASAPDGGARLTLTRTGDDIAFELAEGGKSLKSTTIPAKDATGILRFARRPIGDGRVALRVALPTRPVFAETATIATTKTAAENTKIGVLAPGTTLDWSKVTAQTTSMIDYSFTGAPVDWRAGKGRWSVKERWTCSPQWGFFAGAQSVNPTLWSRFATNGDFTLEAYLATPMDVTRSERGPTDLNFTVGGDGRDLASGYSFLLGSNGRQTDRLYRGDQLVAEQKYVRPNIVGSDHQDWYYVRLERRKTPEGLRFHFTVDGQEVWNYLDKNPLSSDGHLAFWTYNGDLSIARVRLWHNGLSAGDADTTVHPSTATPAKSGLLQVSDKEVANKTTTGKTVAGKTAAVKAPAAKTASDVIPANALGQWETRRENLLTTSAILRPVTDQKTHALEITNEQSGGDWAVYATRTPFDAADHPTLSFRYRVPANVLVNLYAKVNGKWLSIAFTGDTVTLPRRAADVTAAASSSLPPMGWGADVYAGTLIGKIDDVVIDNKWHSATFDLLAALKTAGQPTKVEALAFAAPDRDYLRAGLGGNHLGAKYWISDFNAPLAGQKIAAR